MCTVALRNQFDKVRQTGRYESVPSLLTCAQILDSDWTVFVQDNENNKGQKCPF